MVIGTLRLVNAHITGLLAMLEEGCFGSATLASYSSCRLFYGNFQIFHDKQLGREELLVRQRRAALASCFR